MFLENGVFAPCRKKVALTKNGENDDLHSTHKNKGLWYSDPETDENGGCHSSKTTVCQTLCFRHPDIALLQNYCAAECTKIARFSAVAAAIFTAPGKSRDFLRPQDARFPLRRKSLANRDFFCDENG